MDQALLDRINATALGDADELVVPSPDIVAFSVGCMRLMRGWKVATLASFADVSVSSVERIERGERVSVATLDRVGAAFGCPAGYFTAPRRRLSQEEAASNMGETYSNLEPIDVRLLGTQRQIRMLASCHGLLVHAPGLEDELADLIDELKEWLELSSFLVEFGRGPRSDRGRRDLYAGVLGCAGRLRQRGIAVLAGVAHAGWDRMPDWKIAVLALSRRSDDPGVDKRKVMFVNRRILLPAHATERQGGVDALPVEGGTDFELRRS